MVELTALDEIVQFADDLHMAEMDICTIGRHNTCQVVIPHKGVSRLHAKIERSGAGFMLSDLESANGTYVNRQRIYEPHRLETGDEIGVGGPEPLLRFYDPNDMTIQSPNREWFQYNAHAMVFFLRGHEIDLSISQFRLLSHLYRHAGEVCTREQCAEVIWGKDYDPTQLANLDEAMNKLRRKLVSADPNIDAETREIIRKQLITTRPGLGYVLYLSPEHATEQARQF